MNQFVIGVHYSEWNDQENLVRGMVQTIESLAYGIDEQACGVWINETFHHSIEQSVYEIRLNNIQNPVKKNDNKKVGDVMDLVFDHDQGVFKYPVVGVCMINNHVLIHRAVKDSHWALPGGRTQFLEASEDALIREFYEELGVHVEVQQLLWIVENFLNTTRRSYMK